MQQQTNSRFITEQHRTTSSCLRPCTDLRSEILQMGSKCSNIMQNTTNYVASDPLLVVVQGQKDREGVLNKILP